MCLAIQRIGKPVALACQIVSLGPRGIPKSCSPPVLTSYPKEQHPERSKEMSPQYPCPKPQVQSPVPYVLISLYCRCRPKWTGTPKDPDPILLIWLTTRFQSCKGGSLSFTRFSVVAGHYWKRSRYRFQKWWPTRCYRWRLWGIRSNAL